MQKPNQKKASTLIPGASGGGASRKRGVPATYQRPFSPAMSNSFTTVPAVCHFSAHAESLRHGYTVLFHFVKKITMQPDADIAGNLPAGLLPRINPLSSKLCPPNSRKPGNSLTNFVPRKSKPNDKHLPHCSRATNH